VNVQPVSQAAIYASRPIKPDVLAVLEKLQPGQKIQITHLVRVGLKTWPVTIAGTFRHVDSLATGIATERLPADDIIVPIVHFTKDNQEMSSVALDEHTRIEIMS
jgi:hypothetical protein